MNTEKITRGELIKATRSRLRTIQEELNAIRSKYEQEIADLNSEKKQLKTFIDSITGITKVGTQAISARKDKLSFRTNSKMKRAYEVLRKSSKPMNVVEILEGIGEPVTPASKATMASGLYRAAKKTGEIQVSSPGLFAFQKSKITGEEKSQTGGDIIRLPSDFGKDNN